MSRPLPGILRPLLRYRWAGAAALAIALFAQLGCSNSTEPADEKPTGPVITLWAGTPNVAGYDGDGHKPTESYFYHPADVLFSTTGPYVADWNNHRIRRLTESGVFETVMGTNLEGDGDLPNFYDRVQPVPATTINLNHPTGLMELPNGHLLVSCWHNHKIREYDPTTGMAWVIVGDVDGYSGDGGDARDALIDFPMKTVRGSDGSLYILDQRNVCVRRVTPGFIMETVCGVYNTRGYNGDGIDPKTALLDFADGSQPPISGALAMDAEGRLYISDWGNHRIRRVDFTTNLIETIAGNGVAAYNGDGGAATAASLNYPLDIAFGPDGDLYIADQGNSCIRAVDLDTGIIRTVAGNGTAGYSGDGGPATEAHLNRPAGIAFDSNGDLFVVDTFNFVIRRVDLTP
jgi:hypothetical protein